MEEAWMMSDTLVVSARNRHFINVLQSAAGHGEGEMSANDLLFLVAHWSSGAKRLLSWEELGVGEITGK